MSNNIGFFTAVKYGQNKTFSQSILEKVDNYFYLGGKKAHIIQGKTKQGHEKARLAETNSSLLARVGKVLSYFTVILPLAMLFTKAILRATHTFRLIDPKKKLEKGIDISKTALNIQRLMPEILLGKNNDEIEWLSYGHNLVFKLKENPQLVFKTARPNNIPDNDRRFKSSNEKINERFENMIKAKEVCIVNQLGLLVIPHAKKFTVNVEGKTYTFIAEESLNINTNESVQEHLYHTYSKQLNETARQLAIFVAKSGFNDVAFRNIPVLNEALTHSGPMRIGLVDLEHMESVVNGFTGDCNGSRGLIKCATSEAQIDAILEEARKHGVALTSEEAQDMKQQRLHELEDYKRLQSLYEKNKIVTGKEPIQVDLESLGLDLTENTTIFVTDVKRTKRLRKQAVTLRKVTEDVIAEINKLIQESSDTASAKRKRYVVLETNKDPINTYDYLPFSFHNSYNFNAKEEKQLWLPRIIQALVEKGHLFKLDRIDGHGYWIQA